jgi:predicted HicB family RNase H-like nuclease
MVTLMSETKKEIREKTSIKIKPSIWKDAKKAAIDEGKTVSELMEEAIMEYLKEFKKK